MKWSVNGNHDQWSTCHSLQYRRGGRPGLPSRRAGISWVDVGGGWLIFKLPPAEIAIHPTPEVGKHEFYLMCDDIEQTVAALTGRGVTISHPVRDESWGRLISIQLPSGAELSIYQPRHATAYDLKS